jgi:hypothetical protein
MLPANRLLGYSMPPLYSRGFPHLLGRQHGVHRRVPQEVDRPCSLIAGAFSILKISISSRAKPVHAGHPLKRVRCFQRRALTPIRAQGQRHRRPHVHTDGGLLADRALAVEVAPDPPDPKRPTLGIGRVPDFHGLEV